MEDSSGAASQCCSRAGNSSAVPVKNTWGSLPQRVVFLCLLPKQEDFNFRICFHDCPVLVKRTDLKHAALNTLLNLQEIISDNCVVIFSKTTCVYCKMAKRVFEGMNVNYTAVELDLNTNGSQFQDILEQMTGGRTVSI